MNYKNLVAWWLFIMVPLVIALILLQGCGRMKHDGKVQVEGEVRHVIDTTELENLLRRLCSGLIWDYDEERGKKTPKPPEVEAEIEDCVNRNLGELLNGDHSS